MKVYLLVHIDHHADHVYRIYKEKEIAIDAANKIIEDYRSYYRKHNDNYDFPDNEYIEPPCLYYKFLSEGYGDSVQVIELQVIGADHGSQ